MDVCTCCLHTQNGICTGFEQHFAKIDQTKPWLDIMLNNITNVNYNADNVNGYDNKNNSDH